MNDTGTARCGRGRAAAQLPSSALRAVHQLFVAGEVDAAYLDATPCGAWWPRVGDEAWRRGSIPIASSAVVFADTLRGPDAGRTSFGAGAAGHSATAGDDAADSGVVVAITAADGTLLWVEGDPEACRKAEAMNFVPGADWSERSAGTNAPGTALALDRELQIRELRALLPRRPAVELHRRARPRPGTGALLGAIDLTGGAEVASAQALALVRATAVAVENHLALLRLTKPVAGARSAQRPHCGCWAPTGRAGRPPTSAANCAAPR